MKMIAHRGASLECQEDTLESLLKGAELGAYAVECDPRITADGKIVLFHDDNLARLAGDKRAVNTLTLDEMREAMAAKGLTVTTLDELFEKFDNDTNILLDLTSYKDEKGYPNLVCDDAFFEMLSKQKQNLICGVHFVQEAVSAAKYFPPERILAFMLDKNLYEDFYKAGAGNIRLWENWLDDVTPADVKAKCPDADVWIMSRDPRTDMNGNEESLRKIKELGADGVLLNNIRMAMDWQKANPEV